MSAAPTLTELRDTLRAAVAAYPELRRGLCAALAQVEQVLGEAPPPQPPRVRRYGKRPGEGLR